MLEANDFLESPLILASRATFHSSLRREYHSAAIPPVAAHQAISHVPVATVSPHSVNNAPLAANVAPPVITAPTVNPAHTAVFLTTFVAAA